jgi:eukaryotic-like serine/threonine-protein kinase
MALSPGTRLGPYEVLAPIGQGGMGEVYRARDTKLSREVALKILPEGFAHDPDRLARFGREAQVLASLNHPNIGGIYGLEDSADTKALVLELVEGPTLADRIAEGPLPTDEALQIAQQIGDALEAAHNAGIVRRDLKPANIKLTLGGNVKVLDFGLAKAIDASPALGGSSSLSLSPTITTPAMTQVGFILGTAAYMSPEQAKGKAVDKRTDIWAFGVVLFEMLTGHRPFAGDEVSDVLASVLAREPQLAAIPDTVPAIVRQVLKACLQKDPKKRIHDMADVRLALSGAFETVRDGRSGRHSPTLEVDARGCARGDCRRRHDGGCSRLDLQAGRATSADALQSSAWRGDVLAYRSAGPCDLQRRTASGVRRGDEIVLAESRRSGRQADPWH